MRRDGRFDFFDEDLFAAGVDRHRIAAQQFDTAVGAVAGPVTGYRVTHAVDHREGGRRLYRVALVTQWYVAPLGEPAHSVVTRLQDRLEVFGGDEGIRSGIEGARRHGSRRRHVVHLRTGLRRADAIDDYRVRQNVDQALLDVRGQQRPAVGHYGQRRHIRDALLDRSDQGPRHGVADHRHGHHLLPLDGADHIVSV